METLGQVLTDGELEVLGNRIAETAVLIDRATHRLLTDLRRFDEAQGWRRDGMLSAAHWLSWRAGISMGTAREQVRPARGTLDDHAGGRRAVFPDFEGLERGLAGLEPRLFASPELVRGNPCRSEHVEVHPLVDGLAGRHHCIRV